MKGLSRTSLLVLCLALAACVTVNVYFPAAAVEQAADKIVREIYGAKIEQQKNEEQKAPERKPPEPPAKPQGEDKSGAVEPSMRQGAEAKTPTAVYLDLRHSGESRNPVENRMPVVTAMTAAEVAWRVLEVLVPAAYAQAPDIDVSSPGINQLKSAMQARHQQLTPFYNAGAVGLTANGLLALRDPKAVSLKDRNALSGLIAVENSDRNALYKEIADANGHPEWEREIRTIFDRRWVANAPSGWWFQDANGNWVQK